MNEIIVLDIAGERALVHAANSFQRRELRRIGFAEGLDDRMVMPLHDDDARVRVVVRLIDLGALFSDGRDWCPAALVHYYREQSLIKGSFRVITWRNPEEFFVSTQ
ncbi:hypothetical protein [Massilia sp. BKSP1R2A-1]|uniref:hypothetical protein n=1 Tax=Massilia sp. BKSP1R2A-1 TaxID=3422595 RepID=UPI003D35736D